MKIDLNEKPQAAEPAAFVRINVRIVLQAGKARFANIVQ